LNKKVSQRDKKSAASNEPSLDDFSEILDVETLESETAEIEENLKSTFNREITLRPSMTLFGDLEIEITDSKTFETEVVELKMIAQIKSNPNEIVIEPVDSNDVNTIVQALKEFSPQTWPEVEQLADTTVIKLKLMRVTKQYRDQLCKIAKDKTTEAKEKNQRLFRSADKNINRLKNEGEITDDEYRLADAALLQWNKFNNSKLESLLSEKTKALMNEA